MAAPLRLVDTSAWIEWLQRASTLGKTLGKQFPDKPECVVPAIVPGSSCRSGWDARWVRTRPMK